MTQYYIYFIILIITLVIGLIRYKKLNSSSRILLLLLFLTIVSESIATFVRFSTINNLFVYHIFGPIEVFLIALAFYIDMRKKIIIIVTVLILLFSIVNSIWIQNINVSLNTNLFVLDALLAIFLSLWYLQMLLKDDKVLKFTDYPLFWIGIGFTIFNIVNLFILGAFNYAFSKHSNWASIFRNIRFISNYLLYILFIVGFFTKQRLLNDSNRR